MIPCPHCPRRGQCRVPTDLVRFDHVAHRLEAQHRAPALQRRLHYYLSHGGCLVQAGYVDH